jgi:hypothetical protein
MIAYSRSKALRLALLLLFLSPRISLAQLSTGIVAGKLRDADGQPMKAAAITVSSELGFRAAVKTDPEGTFLLTLPYGNYQLSVEEGRSTAPSSVSIQVEPLQNMEIALRLGSSGKLEIRAQSLNDSGNWAASPRRELYPGAFAFSGVMLDREPLTVTQPLNFAGLGDNRLPWQSQRGFSWTGTQFKLLGMDATDSFQPGQTVILPDVNSLGEVVARSGLAQTNSTAYSTEIGLFPPQPSRSWHGTVFTSDTAAAFASGNLPAPVDRGALQQTEQHRWFTRDATEAGGALAKWADLFVSAAGEWGTQTIPVASPGNDLHSRMLFTNSRLRLRAGFRDEFDFLYSGSRLDLANWGMPSALEVFAGRRMAPSFVSPFGFQNESESDRFNFLQIGWSHSAPDMAFGALQLRYEYSLGHLDTTPLGVASQSRIDLLSGSVAGAAPLANAASQTRQQLSAVWQPSALHAAKLRHQLVLGAGLESSSPRNRFTTPSDMNLITANGAPAFAVEFNTPSDSRSIVRTATLSFADRVVLGSSFSFDFGASADFLRGSLPSQSTPAGIFTPARSFSSQPDLIPWNSISPRAGFAWVVPDSHGVVLRAAYFRVYAPLAGRYLDFGNSNSLGGNEFQWIDRNGDGLFEPGELGALLLNFGGPYSSISPSLARPYADEFDIGAEISPTHALALRVSFFRRDDKNRIAAVNTGVPASAFSPVPILDPGPDGIPGTFDDQHLTVYSQNPATFGEDRYLLTNPPDLRTLDKGLQAEIRAAWRTLFINASFVAEQSYGPTNPGNAVFENDPGVVGSLFMDPNTLVNANGRGFMDRAYAGKIQGTYRLPWGGIEVAGVVDYFDGLAFARQLLAPGLAQGPIVIDATSRGTDFSNPLSGNRAQAVINGNLRFGRTFRFPQGRLPKGTLGAALEILNVANSGYRTQENDATGTAFNLRLPVQIQPARFARIELRYTF